jgi:hypothetical protein
LRLVVAGSRREGAATTATTSTIWATGMTNSEGETARGMTGAGRAGALHRRGGASSSSGRNFTVRRPTPPEGTKARVTGPVRWVRVTGVARGNGYLRRQKGRRWLGPTSATEEKL